MIFGKFPKSSRLLKKEDFLGLRLGASKINATFLWAYVKKRGKRQDSRIGISVSKKVGSAVRRNYLKRIIREAFRSSLHGIDGRDILIVVSPKLFKSIPEKEKAGEKIRTSLKAIFSKIERSSIHA